MTIIINPGAGPVESPSSPEQALSNMEALVADVVAAGATCTIDGPVIDPDPEDIVGKLMMGGTKYSEIHDGRFPFLVTVNGHKTLVEMPGIPLSEVRYVGADGQNIFDFPRIFVNGSSWIWYIGVSVLSDIDGDWA